jgi:hypothetical protein
MCASLIACKTVAITSKDPTQFHLFNTQIIDGDILVNHAFKAVAHFKAVYVYLTI